MTTVKEVLAKALWFLEEGEWCRGLNGGYLPEARRKGDPTCLLGDLNAAAWELGLYENIRGRLHLSLESIVYGNDRSDEFSQHPIHRRAIELCAESIWKLYGDRVSDNVSSSNRQSRTYTVETCWVFNDSAADFKEDVLRVMRDALESLDE